MINISKGKNLVWLDLEMSGLNASSDVVLEIAMIITDVELNVLFESDSFAIFQNQTILDNMDAWNTKTHNESGLIRRVQESSLTVEQVDRILFDHVKKYVKCKASPLCGNSVHQDRRFLERFFPHLFDYLHYRNLDVSSVKELAKRWYPKIYGAFNKTPQHLALADIRDSIAELKYYRKTIFLHNNSNQEAIYDIEN